jgi:ABC-type transport system involved in multi-copper enzyme maturation permease subunit
VLASFGIPTDVRSQTIHTIVTKPVERFEIVIGRFLGFGMLMTLVLAVMTGVSLLYVVRTTTGYGPFSFLFPEINREAQFESLRARVPVYGTLSFQSRDPKFKGTSVGREWEYRSYIAGGANSSQRAIWSFTELPASLANRDEATVPCEFSFDIFRTLKGEEGKGVLCSFFFQTRNWDPAQKSKFDADKAQERSKPGADQAAIDNALAEKYGYFEVANKEVADYHTQGINIPTALFKNALSSDRAVKPGPQGAEEPLLRVSVKCESGGQYLGVARYDYYILDHEGNFAWNFVKGALGLWLRLCIVLGVAVTCSTYLSGVVTLVVTAFVYFAGFFKDYVRALAENTSAGGGPLESLVRLVQREAPTTPLDISPGTTAALGTDNVYRWVLRRVLNLLPDVDRFNWTSYVSEGFNIATVNLLSVNALVVAAYLVPWAILAYYLIKTREIATW